MIADKGIERIKSEYKVINGEIIDENNYQMHLPEVFWAVYTSLYNYLEDIMFLNDYYLYINFFLQYPRITQNDIYPSLSFEHIWEEYRNRKMEGMVYRFRDEVEYVFVIGRDFGGDDEDCHMISEICGIEQEIYTYKKNNILYQADEVSNCKGQVSLQLNAGRVVTGRSEGIGGVYDCEGYKMLTALTLEVDEYDYEFIEEEQVKKILG